MIRRLVFSFFIASRVTGSPATYSIGHHNDHHHLAVIAFPEFTRYCNYLSRNQNKFIPFTIYSILDFLEKPPFSSNDIQVELSLVQVSHVHSGSCAQ